MQRFTYKANFAKNSPTKPGIVDTKLSYFDG